MTSVIFITLFMERGNVGGVNACQGSVADVYASITRAHVADEINGRMVREMSSVVQ